jgi:hypothetical protein
LTNGSGRNVVIGIFGGRLGKLLLQAQHVHSLPDGRPLGAVRVRTP